MTLCLRALALLTALLLAAPQGWCCARLALGRAVAEAAAAEPTTGCSCCHPGASKQTPAPEPQPTRTCSCKGDWLVPPTPEDPLTFDPVGTLPPFVITGPALTVGRAHACLSHFRPLAPPLQLLHCVWLC